MKKALPTKHAKHFEKMAELTYAELTQGRESTRLPQTHKLTSLKTNRFCSKKSRYQVRNVPLPRTLASMFFQDIKLFFFGHYKVKECQKN